MSHYILRTVFAIVVGLSVSAGIPVVPEEDLSEEEVPTPKEFSCGIVVEEYGGKPFEFPCENPPNPKDLEAKNERTNTVS